MDSDNSSIDGEVNTCWRDSESLNKPNENDGENPASKLEKVDSPPQLHIVNKDSSNTQDTLEQPTSPSEPTLADDQNHGSPSQQNGQDEPAKEDDNDDHLSLSPAEPSSTARDQSPSRSPKLENNAPNKSLPEDLSDVSDIESLDGGDNDILNREEEEDVIDKKEKTHNGGVSISLNDDEQLDFDEEPEERQVVDDEEDGECEGEIEKAPKRSVSDPTSVPNQVKEELEEGEVSDEGEIRPEESEPRPICRFFSRGACTWGSSCRFLHPGVTDKGNYTMFEMIRPMGAPPGFPPMRGEHYPLEPRPVTTAPGHPPLAAPPIILKDEPPAPESAWERGLRQAKEILKKSTKRKETEVDFEEKKMNLTLGQNEIDKENDYYTRSASPALSPSPERFIKKEYDLPPPAAKLPPHYPPHQPGEEFLPPPPHHPHAVPIAIHDPYYRPPPVHDPYYLHPRPLHPHYEDPHRIYIRGGPPPRYGVLPPPHHEYYVPPGAHPLPPGGDPYDRKAKHRPAREVIVQRVEKARDYKDRSSRSPSTATFERSRRESPARRGRADEWADPWMRSKSPGGGSKRRRSRRSSGSSYSSSSSRSSSSRSSYSSYSRSSRSSRSRSRSRSGSRGRPIRRKPPMQFKLSPSQRKAQPPPPRGKPMTPPPPPVKMTNKLTKLPFAPVSPAEKRPLGGVPPKLLAKAKNSIKDALSSKYSRSRSRSSSASSSVSSSSTSSSSSEDSSSDSSSDGKRTPSPSSNKKKLIADIKALNQKQIKLNMMKSNLPDTKSAAGKKRPGEPISPPKTPPKKGGAPSRREELLKQLKAVEDAIARKRSKM